MKYYNFSDFKVGDQFQTTFTITNELAQSLTELINPKDSNKSKLQSSVFLIYKPLFHALLGRFEQGTIHLKQKANYIKRPSVSDVFDVVIEVIDKYEKKKRKYLIYKTIYSKKGEVYCELLSTQIMALSK